MSLDKRASEEKSNLLFRIVGITKELLVGPGEPAHLECAADARPLNPGTIRWARGGEDSDHYDFEGRTKTTTGTVNNVTSGLAAAISGSSSVNLGVLLLTVVNASAFDSGPFVCLADNGVGDVVVKNQTFLLVRRKFTALRFGKNRDTTDQFFVCLRWSCTCAVCAFEAAVLGDRSSAL